MQPPSEPDLSAFDDETPAFCLVEVALPLEPSHAWVAYACRAAGLPKPRWHPLSRVWTTDASPEPGVHERITINAGSLPRSVRILTEWPALVGRRSSDTGRRIVTALVIGMRRRATRS
ncbi:MAG TPA: hypothetical protein VIF62_14055 [Labilithrix sp.]|jgi:hypothetical protein